MEVRKKNYLVGIIWTLVSFLVLGHSLRIYEINIFQLIASYISVIIIFSCFYTGLTFLWPERFHEETQNNND